MGRRVGHLFCRDAVSFRPTPGEYFGPVRTATCAFGINVRRGSRQPADGHCVWLLFAGRLIGGIASATQATASAALADMSEPDEKAANFGLVGAAFGIGFVFGPLFGGLLGGFGARAPFYAAAALSAANLALGMFVLPETVTDRIRRPFEWRRANPLGAFGSIGKLPGLNRMLITVFITAVAFFVYPAVWAYFGQARFGWDSRMVGLSFGLFGLAVAIVQGLLIRPILRHIGEFNAVIVGLSIDVVAFVALAFITNGTIALILTPVTALGSIAGPALQGLMSRAAGDDQQGELQGVVTSVNAVALIVAPLIMTQIFWYFTNDSAPIFLPGAPFLLSAVLTFVSIWVFALAPTARRAAKI